MKIEQLSDHAGDQLRLTSERHSEAQRAVEASREHLKDAAAEVGSAEQARSWWKRWRNIETPETHDAKRRQREAQKRHSPVSKGERELKQKVDQQEAGVAGEQDLASWISSVLSDQWAGFAGYQNKSGETDLLLVGPSGVWVVEVKNRRVELSAHQDHWHFQKFDNYGNVVGKGLAIDGRGRNWGKQASEVAESLASWLSHNQVDVPVRTAVVLVHPKATVKSGVNPGVDVLTANRSDLIEAMNLDPNISTPDVRDRVAQLVRRDHAHHNHQT